MAPHMFDRPE